jgi:hypothetical protein
VIELPTIKPTVVSDPAVWAWLTWPDPDPSERLWPVWSEGFGRWYFKRPSWNSVGGVWVPS